MDINGNGLQSGCGNEWKIVETILLIKYLQAYSEKRPEKSLLSFKISTSVGSYSRV